MKTVTLCDGKYSFALSDDGQITDAWRHGELWPAGMDLRHTNCFVAALSRIAELEDACEAFTRSLCADSERLHALRAALRRISLMYECPDSAEHVAEAKAALGRAE